MHSHIWRFLGRKKLLSPQQYFKNKFITILWKESYRTSKVKKGLRSASQQQVLAFVELMCFELLNRWAQRIFGYSLLPSSAKTKCPFWSSLHLVQAFLSVFELNKAFPRSWHHCLGGNFLRTSPLSLPKWEIPKCPPTSPRVTEIGQQEKY